MLEQFGFVGYNELYIFLHIVFPWNMMDVCLRILKYYMFIEDKIR